MKKTEDNCIRGCANVNLINRGIEDLKTFNEQIECAAKILNLVGNETRLKILYLIKTEIKVCVCDISDILGISVSAISQQLRKLKDGRLLNSEKIGQTIFYHLHPELEEVMDHVFMIFHKEEIKKVA